MSQTIRVNFTRKEIEQLLIDEALKRRGISPEDSSPSVHFVMEIDSPRHPHAFVWVDGVKMLHPDRC